MSDQRLCKHFLQITNLTTFLDIIHTIDRHAFTIAPPSTVLSGSPSSTQKADGLALYLRHNRVTFIKNGAFSQERFSLVDLSSNLLNHFNFDAFGKRSILEGLNISRNYIERLNSHGTRKMLLTFLDASHNKLTRSGVIIGGVCPRELLDLGWNRIEGLDSDLFPLNCSIKVSFHRWTSFLEKVSCVRHAPVCTAPFLSSFHTDIGVYSQEPSFCVIG